jgi:hypothetical protein
MEKKETKKTKDEWQEEKSADPIDSIETNAPLIIVFGCAKKRKIQTNTKTSTASTKQIAEVKWHMA